jgi:hypothetical protein
MVRERENVGGNENGNDIGFVSPNTCAHFCMVLTVQNRVEFHRKHTVDLVPFHQGGIPKVLVNPQSKGYTSI